MIFRNILLSSIFVGLISGLFYGIFQHFNISPIIYQAEVYEVADREESSASESHHHDVQATSHHHDVETWGPKNGMERFLHTINADVFIAIALSLIIISFMALHNLKADKPQVNAVRGLAWGLAAMLAFFISPAMFGLHPEVPGTVAAELGNRQAWWLLCVALTVAGLAILYYASAKFKIVGLFVAILPHLIGAPMSEQHGFANTDPEAIQALSQLTTQFYTYTAIGMLLFFLLVGSLSGLAVQRYVKL